MEENKATTIVTLEFRHAMATANIMKAVMRDGHRIRPVGSFILFQFRGLPARAVVAWRVAFEWPIANIMIQAVAFLNSIGGYH